MKWLVLLLVIVSCTFTVEDSNAETNTVSSTVTGTTTVDKEPCIACGCEPCICDEGCDSCGA